MRINEVERLVGVSKKSIRYYEEEGLLTPARENGNGYRSYSDADVRALRTIRLLRRLGIPVDEIRRLQNGQLTLSDCMQRHMIALAAQSRTLTQTREVCVQLAHSGAELDTLDVADWTQRLDTLEQGGVQLTDPNRDQKQRKKAAPVLVAALFMALFAAVIVLLAVGAAAGEVPVAVAVIAGAVCLGLILGLVLAVRARLTEIEGGEEDEAAQY